MKTRKEVAAFINKDLGVDKNRAIMKEKGGRWHYGKVELRNLMDFIYSGTPKGKDEEIHTLRF